MAGNDKLYGGGDNDAVTGGTGNDTLFCMNGNDGLSGDDGSDTLNGGNGSDSLTGGSGNDSLFGGTGDDLFIFMQDDGADNISDFIVGAGSQDVISFIGITGINSFADVQGAVTQVGADAVIDLGGTNELTLLGVNAGDLHQDDFLIT